MPIIENNQSHSQSFSQFCGMFDRLKARWKVNSWSLFLILSTFALGGSTCARVAKWLLHSDHALNPVLWWTLYLVLVTLLWPVCVLAYSIPLGQFRFFRNYLKRIASRIIGKKNSHNDSIPRIAAFASGTGSNVENLICSPLNKTAFDLTMVVTNKPGAPVVQLANKHHIPVFVLEKQELDNPSNLLQQLKQHQIDAIILAGYLKKITPELIKAFPNKILNIHPSLLPKYGGKDMYGSHVHNTIIEAGETFSGITIHLVNEEYDQGQILFQEKLAIAADETPDSLAKKIQLLEHQHYPNVIANYLKSPIPR
jgi:formyltetrahydrofolate-dependent phosphoribosylglycinamide formyltransferase